MGAFEFGDPKEGRFPKRGKDRMPRARRSPTSDVWGALAILADRYPTYSNGRSSGQFLMDVFVPKWLDMSLDPEEQLLHLDDLVQQLDQHGHGEPLAVIHVAAAFCAAAMHSHEAGDEQLAWTYAVDATYFAQSFALKSDALRDFSEWQSMRARRAANVRHNVSQAASAKRFAKSCWEAWSERPELYKSIAAFARDMVEKFPESITNPVTVERWVRAWRAGIA